ncbi:alpha/beta fold hydrolase [Microbulbifer hydrolyticus]|uniref:Alpha/beta fold hydrolase n=1 Tax=Microbulbifer hydrolyticus TaxID=48074 RepID=A0A6P1TB66_9GAMM|nr:alpha/beta hydrolase [Microbulbifer hydrolyticus]MBB5210545.1 pimeloyl-ACP methyl ester carboxylesterase [Microbulbifer hydrolyticus]QHQ38985.1 alpha/beta fold hydrolase [Microbulbifer hydrolyticus]
MQTYSDLRYQSSDGLALYARDYSRQAHTGSKPVMLCLHGLTRNSADFEELAEHMARDFRVLVPDQRGRGKSQWDPVADRYQPNTYVADTLGLLNQLNIHKVIIVGTSMGGLMAMIMAATARDRIAGIVLNDIGPEVDPRGLQRIQGYVGKTDPVANWTDAAETVRTLNAVAFPDYTDADWMRMAHQLYFENTQGVPELAYDPAISKPIAADTGSAVPPNLWPLFEGLAGIPTLALRGTLSDILSRACFAEMQKRMPGMQAMEIPGRGHAPALNEPEALAAIDRFVEKLVEVPV